MQNKPIEKNSADENMNQDINQEVDRKIGFKDQKTNIMNAGDTDEKWKKVESVISVAKEIYQSGKSSFHDVVESLVATLQDLLASEEGGGQLGGLYGGPQMDIPAGPEPTADDQPQ